jgi:two-component system sensor histidine kinase DegS
VARECFRILQEALVNIRKHSRARNAVVRLSLEDHSLKLVIDDDGKGFDFAGRLSLDQLDAQRRGPTIIKERVRALSGNMIIDSIPGSGTRLEIALPR